MFALSAAEETGQNVAGLVTLWAIRQRPVGIGPETWLVRAWGSELKTDPVGVFVDKVLVQYNHIFVFRSKEEADKYAVEWLLQHPEFDVDIEAAEWKR